MSVIASKRNPSRFEPIKHAVDLRVLLTALLVRNFGIKDLEHVVRIKYAFGKDRKEDLPKYIFIMASCKNRIDMLASHIEANVRAANTIYPVSIGECDQRREFQNVAIVNCEQLISELQYIVNMFWVDINDYRQYVEAIDQQIALIKKWRQSDNRIRKKLLKGGI